jgi:hypothetical protein
LEVAFTVVLSADGVGAVYSTRGVLTGEDLVGADRELRALIAEHREIRYVFVDYSSVTEEQLEPAVIRELAGEVQDYLALIPEAIVAIAAPSAALFGLCRMWESLVARPEFATFVGHSRDEALTWLAAELEMRGLPADRMGQSA